MAIPPLAWAWSFCGYACFYQQRKRTSHPRCPPHRHPFRSATATTSPALRSARASRFQAEGRAETFSRTSAGTRFDICATLRILPTDSLFTSSTPLSGSRATTTAGRWTLPPQHMITPPNVFEETSAGTRVDLNVLHVSCARLTLSILDSATIVPP